MSGIVAVALWVLVGSPAEVPFGVFEGRTPCSPIANAFTGFPSKDCEKIKWELTLYREAVTGQPSRYVYKGTRSSREGKWTSERGAGPARSWTVCHLFDGEAKVLSLLMVDDNVLLLLDKDLRVMVGDASWSYALNRTNKAPR